MRVSRSGHLFYLLHTLTDPSSSPKYALSAILVNNPVSTTPTNSLICSCNFSTFSISISPKSASNKNYYYQ